MRKAIPTAGASRRGRKRRGVLLLIVLSLLAMFAMVGITFVILTNHARRSAEVSARAEQYVKSPERTVDTVAMMCLRGTNNPASVLRTHSLLEDLLGHDATLAALTFTVVASAPETTGGQILTLDVNPSLTVALGNRLSVVGRVLTFTTGDAAGTSTRVVGSINGTRIQIVGVPGIVAGNQFILNSIPFSGTGFGYIGNTAAAAGDPLLTALDGNNLPYALLPNPASFPDMMGKWGYNPAYGTDPAGPGGANEDYDAADYQNMLLGLQDPTNNTTPIPSLHRPSLVNYWFSDLPTLLPGFQWPTNANSPAERLQAFLAPTAVDASNNPIWNWNSPAHRDALVALKRRIILRPSTEDHPAFTGSNPDFNPLWDGFTVQDTNGNLVPDCWDVDNDGDGVPDSIWVDAGLPVQSTKEGIKFKPLVAILCVDLDGRLNLNAHGSLAQTNAGFQTPTTLPGPIAAGGLTVLPDPALVLRGQGVGPAEVSLFPLLSDLSFVGGLTAEQQHLALLAGRYGPDGMPGWAFNPALATGYDYPPPDPLAANKLFDFPGWYDLSATFAADNSGTGSYGTPMDLMGGIAVGLDLRGQPLYVGLPGQFFGIGADVGHRTDNPYEFNLSRASRGTIESNSADTPFTPNELEALLRWYDIDAGTLPDRLTALAPSLKPDPALGIAGMRGEVTTESWSVPCPAVALPPELRANAAAFAALNNGRAGHVVDLLRAKLFKENASLNPANPAHVQTVETMMTNLLSPDALMGLRFDLNRLFGNGRDGNGNGVIDEPWELDVSLGLPLHFPQVNAAGADATLPVLDPDNDGTPGTDYNDANSYYARERQDYARQLYVMMLVLMNHEVAMAGTPTQDEKDTARMVAQWAVNIVDFRDRDSIMTPFEYDIDPFRDANSDGIVWDVDGRIGTPSDPSPDDSAAYRGLVWGCERPELLISETLAVHDRRTRDTDLETPIAPEDATVTTETDPTKTPDTDFDQQRRPQGSLFVELYNPWTDNEPKPGELYETTHGGVDLTRRGPDNTPVWRLVITSEDAADPTKEIDNPVATDRPDIERAAYFVNSAAGLPTDGDVQFYRVNANSPIAPIRPGRYAVIGPDDDVNDGRSITHLGRCPAGPNTRRIDLQPSANPNGANQVRVYADGQNDLLASLSIQPPTAIILSSPGEVNMRTGGRFSISEPTSAYPGTDSTLAPNTYNATTEMYTKPWDLPQDKERYPELWDLVKENGIHPRLAIVHLQRLANPLMPYDRDANPYRTIDSMQVDLTTFNSVQLATDECDEDKANLQDAFFSRGRGLDGGTSNLWLQPEIVTTVPTATNLVTLAPGADSHLYNEPFASTLGYLNEGFNAPQAGPMGAGYAGHPQQPFPWFTWLNRPFVSAGELALVPKRRSSQLLRVFSIANAASDPYEESDQPFGHLINFWYDDTTTHPLTATPNWKLHRLLEFVHVPSRFVGTELQGNPQAFSGGAHSFQPPFNRISNYREPGKVNLNTITSPRVWKGLLGGTPSPTFVDFVASRRASTAGTDWDLDPALPTRFANPFRSFAGKYLVPLPALQTQIDEEVNATILRPEMTGGGFGNTPLFDFASIQAANDTNRNPAFRNQSLTRLGNVATNRSNVYAIWITVGYFEVTAIARASRPDLSDAQFAAIYPDGYQLGRELGSDAGETTRHRAFYIIDRSIPVGFQRGEDLNSRDAILLQRLIE